jgi:nitrogen-specific signal transduction histidine kinase
MNRVDRATVRAAARWAPFEVLVEVSDRLAELVNRLRDLAPEDPGTQRLAEMVAMVCGPVAGELEDRVGGELDRDLDEEADR